MSARLDSVEARPEAKALSEGYLAGAALVNQGGDLVAGQGMMNAVSAAKASRSGFSAFGTLSGGKSRYDTGSNVDMSSVSLLAGVSFGANVSPGRLTLGAFVEYGNGSYDTHNSFSTLGSVKGDGDLYHVGAGVLGRMDFTGGDSGHAYAESSFRAGRLHNEYKGNLRDGMERNADYDSSASYFGLHLGGGYVVKLTDKVSLDLYGKYFWTRQGDDSARLSTRDAVEFDAVNSHRLRAGSRFSYAVNERVTPYVGAAYEHEFNGKAKATTYGYAIDAPELRGGTGIGEAGVVIKAGKSLNVDLGLQGYAGKRRGVTGSANVRVAF